MIFLKKICIIYNFTEKLSKGIPGDLISFNSVIPTIEEIKVALESKNYKVVLLPLKNNLSNFIKNIKKIKPDLVFNLCEAHQGNSHYEINIPAVLELLEIPFTGSSPFSLGLTLNKAMTKDILISHQINTPRYEIFSPGVNMFNPASGNRLSFPLIVKPISEDGSLGIDDASVVKDDKKLKKRINYVHKYYRQAAIVEEYLPGREIYVSIIGNSPPLILPFAELDYSNYSQGLNRICSYKAKWEKDCIEYSSKSICPIKINKALKEKINQMSLKVYDLTGCRDYARIDLRLDKKNKPSILEINANPDLSSQAGFVNSALAQGLSYADLIEQIVKNAWMRREHAHIGN